MIDRKIDAAIEKHYSHPQKTLFSTGARQLWQDLRYM